LAVVLTLGTEEGSIPVNWALHLPIRWTSDSDLRRKAAIPEETTYKDIHDLALELIDEVRSWGLQERIVLADEHYGESHDFRMGLKERALGYVVQVTGNLRAWTNDPSFTGASKKGGGRSRPAQAQSEDRPVGMRLEEIAEALPRHKWRRIAWREAPERQQCARFARIGVSCIDGQNPDRPMPHHPEELLIERPEYAKYPFAFWLSGLGPDSSWQQVVRSAKGRFRFARDNQEMRTERGVDHYEGRSWPGWHHHVTLVTMAQAFLLQEEWGKKRKFWVDPIS
jgi:SRSO17 transposase